MNYTNNRSVLLLPMLVSLLSLQGCATTSNPQAAPSVVSPPQIPPPPEELMQPPKQPETYLQRAQSDIQAWRKKLEPSQDK